MRRARVVGFVALVGALLSGPAAEAQDVHIGGFLQLDRRLTFTDDSAPVADFYNVVRPQLTASFEERADVVVSLDLRFHDFSAVRSSDELADAGRHFPVTSTVWEAFAHVSGFLVDPLDVTLGKQRVRWGTADGLNPTDRFDAHDLSDLTDFTARIPTWAVRAEYHVGRDWRVEAIWAPTAHAPLLPPGSGGLPAKAEVRAAPQSGLSWERHFLPPAPRPGNSQRGLKLAGHAAGMDLSVSYYEGFDGMPAPGHILLVAPSGASAPGAVGHSWSSLPKLRALGLDFVTERHGLGLWGEGAAVFPNAHEVLIETATDSGIVREKIALADDPYASWTVGADYTFARGWYLNLQATHGLFLERGADALHDYLFGKVEKGLLRQTVVLSLTAAIEVARWADWPDHLGFAMFPEVVYSPVDNIDVSIGALLAGGSDTALFRQWDGADQLYLRLRASF